VRQPDHRAGQVVLQVLPDAGQISDNRNAQLTQLWRRPNPRQHQQLWAVDGTTRDHDLGRRASRPGLAAHQPVNANCTTVLDHQPRRQRVGLDGHHSLACG